MNIVSTFLYYVIFSSSVLFYGIGLNQTVEIGHAKVEKFTSLLKVFISIYASSILSYLVTSKILVKLELVEIFPIVCLLIFVLLLLSLILFIPIRYSIQAKTCETDFSDLKFKLKAHWLLSVLSFKMTYQKEDGLLYGLRLFGFYLFRKKPDERAEDSAESNSENKSDRKSKKAKNKSAKRKAKRSRNQSAKKKEKKTSPDESESKLDMIKHTYSKWKRICSDEHNKNAVHFLKEQLYLLLKQIMPYKMKLQATYSTGSPDTTAEVLGVLAMFPIGYQNKWQVYPDFEADSFYIKGDTHLSGKIFIYQIVVIALRVYFNREVRRLHKMIKRL